MPSASWVPVPDGGDFPVENLPYGIFSRPGELPRAGVAIGEQVLDLAGLAADGLIEDHRWFAAGSLNAFLIAGRATWRANRERLTRLLTDGEYRAKVTPHLTPLTDVTLYPPVRVGDVLMFCASAEHAAAVHRARRSGEPYAPHRQLPVGRHGRAGAVRVSGAPVVRPCGQYRGEGEEGPAFGPTRRLDFQAGLGFVVGVPSAAGRAVSGAAFGEHVFGYVLVNDWAARDVEAWEDHPYGPFLGTSFGTSLSPWLVPLDALEAARVWAPEPEEAPLPYLRVGEDWGLDVTLEVALNGHPVAGGPAAGLAWTGPQLLAHGTVNGAAVRTGDLFGSGAISGGPERPGSMLELTADGTSPVELPDGTARAYLEDGDTISLTAHAPGIGDTRIGFGEVTNTIHPATC
ncbi:MAG: fumarylacetoacetase [Streptosporangiales bacterium]|nr:fumarylacetoacetase [Streptosporangiales bacterium]